jgi:CubicO group peptidase (beta-lactamase class C family)
MKLKLIFIHVFLLSIGLNYTNAQSDSKNDSEKLKARILCACEDLQPTGFAIAIVKDGKTVTEMTWGSKSLEKDQPLENESLFNIASCTKAASEKKIHEK